METLTHRKVGADVTLTWGVWILGRVYADGRIRRIEYWDAPREAREAFDKETARMLAERTDNASID